MTRKLLCALVVAVAVLQAAPPAAAQSYVMGGTDAGQYGDNTACNTGYVLVGFVGRAGLYIDNIAPVCRKVSAAGRWLSDEQAFPMMGRDNCTPGWLPYGCNPGGERFTASCPDDWAVTGFIARSGRWIDHLDMTCRPLTSWGHVSQAGVRNVSVGGTSSGGTRAQRECLFSRPVTKFSARWTDYINRIGFYCRDN